MRFERLVETRPCIEVWGWFSAAGTGRLSRRNSRDINNEKLIQRPQELRLGQRFTFQQDNNPAKTTQERPRDLNTSWIHTDGTCPAWWGLKGSAERNVRRSSNPGASHPRRREDVIEVKGPSAQFWVKAFNNLTYEVLYLIVVVGYWVQIDKRISVST